MKLKAGGIPLLGRSFAVFGVLILAAGLILLAYQTYLYVELGVWGRLPASSLFIELTYPVNLDQVSKNAERLRSAPGASTQRQLPASAREFIVYERLNSVVPDWFRSKPSWLADPNRLYGLHNIVSWLLDFLSIPAFLFLAGITILAIGLRDLPRGAEPAGREHAT